MKPQRTPTIVLSAGCDDDVLFFPAIDRVASAPTSAPPLAPAEGGRLSVLRELLAKSRLEGENDLEAAFARLAANPDAGPGAFGVTLFHTLPIASVRGLTFFCRVCPKASLDEWWLLRLIDALRSRDGANVEALLGFRIRKHWRRRIRFLAAGLAAGVDDDWRAPDLAPMDTALPVTPPPRALSDGRASS